MSEDSIWRGTSSAIACGKAQLQFYPIKENISLCVKDEAKQEGLCPRQKEVGLVKRRPLVTQVRLLRVRATYWLSNPGQAAPPSVNWG